MGKRTREQMHAEACHHPTLQLLTEDRDTDALTESLV